MNPTRVKNFIAFNLKYVKYYYFHAGYIYFYAIKIPNFTEVFFSKTVMYQFRILYNYVALVLPALTSSCVRYAFVTDCKKLECLRFGWPPISSFIQYFVQIGQQFSNI